MIVKNTGCQCISCTICGENTEISRRRIGNPELILLLIEELQKDHAACEQWAHDPRRAAIERGYLVRMRAELRKKR